MGPAGSSSMLTLPQVQATFSPGFPKPNPTSTCLPKSTPVSPAIGKGDKNKAQSSNPSSKHPALKIVPLQLGSRARLDLRDGTWRACFSEPGRCRPSLHITRLATKPLVLRGMQVSRVPSLCLHCHQPLLLHRCRASQQLFTPITALYSPLHNNRSEVFKM